MRITKHFTFFVKYSPYQNMFKIKVIDFRELHFM